MAEAFGRGRVLDILAETVEKISREPGVELAEVMGNNDAATFLASLAAWARGGALEIETVSDAPMNVDFNVIRCRDVEMCRDLGIPKLGAILSCNPDHEMIEGFAPEATRVRTQTILSGATHCDFRYEFSTRPTD